VGCIAENVKQGKLRLITVLKLIVPLNRWEGDSGYPSYVLHILHFPGGTDSSQQ